MWEMCDCDEDDDEEDDDLFNADCEENLSASALMPEDECFCKELEELMREDDDDDCCDPISFTICKPKPKKKKKKEKPKKSCCCKVCEVTKQSTDVPLPEGQSMRQVCTLVTQNGRVVRHEHQCRSNVPACSCASPPSRPCPAAKRKVKACGCCSEPAPLPPLCKMPAVGHTPRCPALSQASNKCDCAVITQREMQECAALIAKLEEEKKRCTLLCGQGQPPPQVQQNIPGQPMEQQPQTYQVISGNPNEQQPQMYQIISGNPNEQPPQVYQNIPAYAMEPQSKTGPESPAFPIQPDSQAAQNTPGNQTEQQPVAPQNIVYTTEPQPRMPISMICPAAYNDPVFQEMMGAQAGYSHSGRNSAFKDLRFKDKACTCGPGDMFATGNASLQDFARNNIRDRACSCTSSEFASLLVPEGKCCGSSCRDRCSPRAGASSLYRHNITRGKCCPKTKCLPRKSWSAFELCTKFAKPMSTDSFAMTSNGSLHMCPYPKCGCPSREGSRAI